MNTRKPILVTGSHRSGTTWVGRMIAESSSVGYIHEPFNPRHPSGICTVKFPHWFTYITDENEKEYYEPLSNTLRFRYNVGAELAINCTPRRVARMLKNCKNYSWYRLRHAIPLMKDPIALLSSEWLASRFDMSVIVLIRHPAAFADSLKRLNWEFDFSDFLNQPLLMRDHFAPFEADIRKYASERQDILDQSILLWNTMHDMILKYRDAHKDWIFIRHEDVSKEPLPHFEYLYKRLRLDFTEHVKAVIVDYSNSANPVEPQKGHMLTKRDSKLNIKSWKKKLSEEEITRIRVGTEQRASQFYSDDDW